MGECSHRLGLFLDFAKVIFQSVAKLAGQSAAPATGLASASFAGCVTTGAGSWNSWVGIRVAALIATTAETTHSHALPFFFAASCFAFSFFFFAFASSFFLFAASFFFFARCFARFFSFWLEKRWIVGERFSTNRTFGTGGLFGDGRQKTLYVPINSLGLAIGF